MNTTRQQKPLYMPAWMQQQQQRGSQGCMPAAAAAQTSAPIMSGGGGRCPAHGRRGRVNLGWAVAE